MSFLLSALFTFHVLFVVSLMTTAKCPEEPCDSGLSCDYNTGVCRRFRIPDGFQLFASEWNKCEFVKCPTGYHCDGISGICVRAQLANVQTTLNLCDGIECPPQYICMAGKCLRQFNGYDYDGICENVNCPHGYTCTPPDAVCRKIFPQTRSVVSDELKPSHLDDAEPVTVRCPPNSHYEPCGSPCTLSCTEVQPKCKREEHECIRTCSCDDGHVQVSALNTTCVASHECVRISAINEHNCQGLRCQLSVCVDGYCNAADCPAIMKPQITPSCNKLIVVRDRRNCLGLINECDLY